MTCKFAPLQHAVPRVSTAKRTAFQIGSTLVHTDTFPDIVLRAPVVEVAIVDDPEFDDPGIVREGDREMGVSSKGEDEDEDTGDGLFKDDEWRAFQMVRRQGDARIKWIPYLLPNRGRIYLYWSVFLCVL